MLFRSNDNIDFYNSVTADNNKKKEGITYESLYKDYNNFDNQDEIEKAFQSLLINYAIYNVLSPISKAFTTGQVDPRSVYFSRRE